MSQNQNLIDGDIPQVVDFSGGADRDRTDDLMTARNIGQSARIAA
jgi:hypothetical protein